MKRFLIIAIASLFMLPSFGQEQELSKKEQKKLMKELKKEQQAEEAAKKNVMTALMVEGQTFVLEADRLQDSKGNTVSVSSMINFIACDSVNGVVQIGSDHYIGGNGVGGVTVEGPVTNYKYSLNEKKGTYSVSFNVRSTIGSYDVRISVYGEGRADATVTSNWPGRLNYSGYLVSPANSKVYKGNSF